MKRPVNANAILKRAIPIIRELRGDLFRTNEIHGRVYEPRALAELRKLDRWLKQAREIVS